MEASWDHQHERRIREKARSQDSHRQAEGPLKGGGDPWEGGPGVSLGAQHIQMAWVPALTWLLPLTSRIPASPAILRQGGTLSSRETRECQWEVCGTQPSADPTYFCIF